MSDALRVCLFDRAGKNETSLREEIAKVPNILLLGHFSTWDELREALRHGFVDMVAINLDGAEGPELEIVRKISELSPSCGIVGISRRADPTSIIAAMRAGCSQFVCFPIDSEDLLAAVQRLRATRQSVAHNSKRICVIGSSGGAGATTVACNLAMELAHLVNRRTLLVDLNLEFGDVACAFDCSPNFSIADVCRDDVDIDRVLLSQALHELPCNISLLGRPERPEDGHQVTPHGVTSMFRVVSEMFPFVVTDLPRAANPVALAAMSNADQVLIVTQLGVPFIRNATRVYECLRAADIPEDSIQIVLNRCKSVYERITPDDVEAHFGKPIFGMIPNDYRRVQSALDLGHPILADAPNTPSRLAIAEMARKIAGDMSPLVNQAAQKAVGGLFTRLWSRPRPVEATLG